MKVIINADDLGISLEVNAQIEDAIKKRLISSATIIANGPAFKDALRIVQQYPHISYGVHLNVIEFKPLTNISIFRKYELLDANDNFIEGAVFYVKLKEELKNAIFEEWSAQVDVLLKEGVPITHIDSHQHTHTIYGLCDVVVNLIKKYNIRCARRPEIMPYRVIRRNKQEIKISIVKPQINSVKKTSILVRGINFYIGLIRKMIWVCRVKRHAKVTSGFHPYYSGVLNGNFMQKRYANKTIELMCHPGHSAYKMENDMLFSNVLNTVLPFELVSYKNY